MVVERLRSALLPVTLATAFVLAITLLWTTNAESKPGSKPVPKSRTAEVQILGLSETHGQLVPLSQRNPDGTRTNVGGAAALATYLEREEAENPLRSLIVDSGDLDRKSVV